MRALLIYPCFPRTFWSFEEILALVDKKVLHPPLGLITVAALLPREWEFRLVDRNIREVSEADWDWADMVFVTGMIVQMEDLEQTIRQAKARGLPVVCGGPLATALPDRVRAMGADFLVLDEGEVTIPLFLEALGRGEGSGTFRSMGARPDLSLTPVPRFDLLETDAYDAMCVQFSRGCPHQCEFCDITVLYGRNPRTKAPEQVLAELDRLLEMGWDRAIFLVDDNFIGNKKKVRELLLALRGWQREKGHPFVFDTEASLDLAREPEILELMADCRFGAVFLGVETPDGESLAATGKHQNLQGDLAESVRIITRAGFRVMAGFILGFDGEAPGAGDRIVRFVEETGIPTVLLSMLQALPGTRLWERLEKEGRLLHGSFAMDQTGLSNFIPTRPLEEIAGEYVDAFIRLYDPMAYLNRTFRSFLAMAPPRAAGPERPPSPVELKAAARVLFRQGIARKTRFRFWRNMVGMALRNPGVWSYYLTVCAHNEHFIPFRKEVAREIHARLRELGPRARETYTPEEACPAA